MSFSRFLVTFSLIMMMVISNETFAFAHNEGYKIYGFPYSASTWRVLAVLHEKGLPHYPITVNLRTGEDHDEPPLAEVETVPLWIPRYPICQIDSSWIDNGMISGLGWSLKDHMSCEVFGLRACNRSLSTLHAEMEGLLWATSYLRDMRITSIRLETDCSDLVDMTVNPTDWPIFATEIEIFQRLQEDFEDVSLSHIPRNRNTRADVLAKEARARGHIFSHIDQTRSDGDALQRIDRLITT